MSQWDAEEYESRIRELIRLARENHLAELSVEEDGVSITVRLVAGPAAVVPVGCGAVAEPLVEAPVEEEANIHYVVSPMAGVFYRAPSPDSSPFVDLGSRVEPGDTVGLVEAMKVFNEIKVEVAGEVVELLADNEDLVSVGRPLVKIRLSET